MTRQSKVVLLRPPDPTPNYDVMKERGDIFSDDWSKHVMFGQAPVWRTRHFEPEELLSHQKRLTRNFYLNLLYMTRMLLRIRSLHELAYYVKAGKAFINWTLGGDAVQPGAEMDLSDADFRPLVLSR